MDSIGAEVGQKMRSAIKAKLLELNCYVDDELPDYIMVMVANKRTKSQMKDDLQLFLTNKTATFVDWLHIVLKKLKEVTVTNPEIYKKTVNKRKSDDCTLQQNDCIKQERKDKKIDKKLIKSEPDSTTINNNEIDAFKSLTDDLPIDANQLAKQRKIVIMKVNQQSNNNSNNMDNKKDNFDIPLLSEVNMSNEEELEMIEQKIKNVKTRLGLLIDNDDNDNNNSNSNDDDEDYINLKAEPDELFGDELKNTNRTIQIIENINLNTNNKQKKPKTRITFNNDDELDENITKKKSVLERLGKRRSESNNENNNRNNKRSRINVIDNEKTKEGVLSRLGVMSKISIPQKSQQQQRNEEEEQEEDMDESGGIWRARQVPSVVKIKPRIIPNDIPQPNKNLLLKAVADAQRSIAQAPKVGINASVKPDALFTKNYKEKTPRKLPETQKEKLKKILEPNNDKEIPQYIPTPIDKTQQLDNMEIKQQFIVTLDGIEKTKFKDLIDDDKKINIGDNKNSIKPSVMSRLDKKKSPSPIVFDKNPPTISTTTTIKSNIPDRLPIVHPPPSIKNKERCKYWPQCRQGDKCEFVHPSINCELFPNCKFAGDKCLYLHPVCKFGSSCTRRDCLYTHHNLIKTTICKYYPSCTNPTCQFYHPKPCKFGKNCKNQDCSFLHDFPITITTQNNLVWKSKF